jgi:hypothetical protein
VACFLLPEEKSGIEFHKYHNPSVFLAILKLRIGFFIIVVVETGVISGNVNISFGIF